jgi:hypothetical protein
MALRCGNRAVAFDFLPGPLGRHRRLLNFTISSRKRGCLLQLAGECRIMSQRCKKIHPNIYGESASLSYAQIGQ